MCGCHEAGWEEGKGGGEQGMLSCGENVYSGGGSSLKRRDGDVESLFWGGVGVVGGGG
mgnify:FL=1